jgi:uncharacterized protein (DUF433 family)
MDWRQHISVDPNVCHGKPCVAGTRVMVWVVLGCLADGMTANEVVEAYPTITHDDVRACLAYAAELAHSRANQSDPSAA